MCGLSGIELLLVVVVAIVVFDPARLPELMAQAGKFAREIKRMRGELGQLGRELQRHNSVGELKKSLLEDPELQRARDRAREVEAEIDALRARLRDSAGVSGAVSRDAGRAASDGHATAGRTLDSASNAPPPPAESGEPGLEPEPRPHPASPAIPPEAT